MISTLSWIPVVAALFVTVNLASAINEVYNEAATCEFPTSLHVGFINPVSGSPAVLCSGVYVGSGLMLTAAHCALLIDEEGEAFVFFGEDKSNPVWATSDVECIRHPAGGKAEDDLIYQGPDIAYCKLDSGSVSEAWPEPPIIPVMVPYSCENDYIYEALFSSPPGATAFPDEPFGLNINKIFGTASGVGMNESGCTLDFEGGCHTGIKRYVDVPIHPEGYVKDTDSIMFYIVQPSPVALYSGDSGGPLYFRMSDNSWRLIGIHIASNTRDLNVYNSENGEIELANFQVAYYTGVPRYVRWIEESSGRDITPCHTYNTTTRRWDFDGDPFCAQNVPTSPKAGDSNWSLGAGEVTACFTSNNFQTDSCAGWTPPPFEPPLAAPGLPNTQAEASLLFAIEGAAPFSAPEPPPEDVGYFGPTSTKLEIFGTEEKDTLQGTTGDDVIYAGRGPDVVHGHEGDDHLLGGDGDDHLMAGPGDDLIIPGRGRDKMNAEGGDDRVVIRGTCELEMGEVLLGGDGNDTLVSPLSIEQLKVRGIIALEFETIEATHPDSEMAVCDPPPSDFDFLIPLP